MTPLEAARLLLTDHESDEALECTACGLVLYADRSVNRGHAPDCPTLMLPQIVAALEAVE